MFTIINNIDIDELLRNHEKELALYDELYDRYIGREEPK